MSLRSRDVRLIDALDGRPGLALERVVWRVVREGRDPCECSASNGRWDDATFDVLYTSCDREGSVAEMRFHLLKGQPIIPSKVGFFLYELKVRLENVLDLSNRGLLTDLGMDLGTFGMLSYGDHRGEYPQPQQISEVAHFHGHDGLLVPSARADCENLVVFCDRIDPEQIEMSKNHGLVSWEP